METISPTQSEIQASSKKRKHVLAPRETTMGKVGSTLAVMFIEETLANGGEVTFPSLGITLTQKDLLGDNEANSSETTT